MISCKEMISFMNEISDITCSMISQCYDITVNEWVAKAL